MADKKYAEDEIHQRDTVEKKTRQQYDRKEKEKEKVKEKEKEKEKAKKKKKSEVKKSEQKKPRPDIISIQSNPGNSTEGIASSFDPDLKTVVLWIYNINQNGTANIFHEDVSQYFTSDKDGNVLFRDMSPDLLAQFITNISTAKEIKMPDLGIRLILLIYNCNQNGSSNSAEIACTADT